MDHERSLRGYLDDVAAGTPAPGGGSVAGIVGALGAALGEMVANLTLGREQFAGAEEALGAARQRLTKLRAALIDAAAADERAYSTYSAAAMLPRGSDEEKAVRRTATQQALIVATDVPLGVARAAVETAEALEVVARVGNPHVRLDAALGALLAEVALRGALLNVRGNASHLRDKPKRNAYLDEANRLEKNGRRAAVRAYAVAVEVAGQTRDR